MAAHQAPASLGLSRQEHWSGLPFPSPMHESEKWKGSRSVVPDPQWPHGLQPTRLPRPWDSPGKNTGVGCHFLLQHWHWKALSTRISDGIGIQRKVFWQLFFFLFASQGDTFILFVLSFPPCSVPFCAPVCGSVGLCFCVHLCAGVGVVVTIKAKDEQEVLTVIHRSVAVFFTSPSWFLPLPLFFRSYFHILRTDLHFLNSRET